MPGLSHKGRRSTKSRPYERRRRTRRLAHRRSQRGGDPPQEQTLLDTWIGAAKELYNTAPGTELKLDALKKEELKMIVQGGVKLPEEMGFSPPYLGDIMASVARGLGPQRIQSGVVFTSTMTLLKEGNPIFYDLMVSLEMALRSHAERTTETPVLVNLSDAPTDGKTPFVWIAYANLPDVLSEEPLGPVLVPEKEIGKLLAESSEPASA